MNNKFLLVFVFLIIYACKDKIQYGINNITHNNYQEVEKEYFKYYLKKKRILMNSITIENFVSELEADTKDNDKLDLIITMGQADSNWINDTDLEFLIANIHSKKKANCINRMISSHIPNSEGMTIGNQIISIIESYRNQEPFPNETCICKMYEQNKIDEILAWWKKKNGG